MDLASLVMSFFHISCATEICFSFVIITPTSVPNGNPKGTDEAQIQISKSMTNRESNPDQGNLEVGTQRTRASHRQKFDNDAS